MRSRIILTGLLVVSLTGCLTPYRVGEASLDPALLEECSLPVLTGNTNAALADYAVRLEQALAACNADKRILRERLQ